MATQLERLATLEARQMAHEEETDRVLSAMSTRIDGVEESMKPVHTALAEIGGTLSSIKSSIESKEAVENAINGDRRQRKLEAKDWIIIAIGLATVASPFVMPLIQHGAK